jgi:hypothetical protein
MHAIPWSPPIPSSIAFLTLKSICLIPIARGVLSCGLVAVPVEIHTTIKARTSSICLHAKCGSHSVTRYFVPHAGSSWSALIWCGDMNSRTERTYVSPTLSSNPLRRSEQRIELKEFIPIKKIDPVYSSRLITRRRTRAGRNPIDCSPTQ